MKVMVIRLEKWKNDLMSMLQRQKKGQGLILRSKSQGQIQSNELMGRVACGCFHL